MTVIIIYIMLHYYCINARALVKINNCIFFVDFEFYSPYHNNFLCTNYFSFLHTPPCLFLYYILPNYVRVAFQSYDYQQEKLQVTACPDLVWYL